MPHVYVANEAEKLGLDGALAVCIAHLESRFKVNAVGDSHLICPATGQPMRSRGLFQINDCFHAEVPDEVAFDPESSTAWALARMKDGYAHEWSTYARCRATIAD